MKTQIFNFNNNEVTVVINENNEPLFVAKEICDILEIQNSRQAVGQLDDDEKLTYVLHRAGQNRNVNVITESGLYSLVLRSNKPEAKVFKKHVTSEILPSIRKTGGYMVTKEEDTPETIMARALQIAQQTLDNHKQRLQILEGENQHQQEQIKVLVPKAEYTDKVLQSTSTLTVNEIALELGISNIKLNKILEEKGVQYKQGKIWLLTTKYRDRGLATLRTFTKFDEETKEQKTYSNTVWTEKGRQFIHSLFSQKANNQVNQHSFSNI